MPLITEEENFIRKIKHKDTKSVKENIPKGIVININIKTYILVDGSFLNIVRDRNEGKKSEEKKTYVIYK